MVENFMNVIIEPLKACLGSVDLDNNFFQVGCVVIIILGVINLAISSIKFH